jgi:hypothetical protein
MRRTPPLSLKGSREVLEEMSRPPADTPERRRMWEIVDRWRRVPGSTSRWVYVREEILDERGIQMSMRRTPPLSIEGSREVLEEMSRPPENTPERRATLDGARELADVVEEAIRPRKPVPSK